MRVWVPSARSIVQSAKVTWERRNLARSLALVTAHASQSNFPTLCSLSLSLSLTHSLSLSISLPERVGRGLRLICSRSSRRGRVDSASFLILRCPERMAIIGREEPTSPVIAPNSLFFLFLRAISFWLYIAGSFVAWIFEACTRVSCKC